MVSNCCLLFHLKENADTFSAPTWIHASQHKGGCIHIGPTHLRNDLYSWVMDKMYKLILSTWHLMTSFMTHLHQGNTPLHLFVAMFIITSSPHILSLSLPTVNHLFRDQIFRGRCFLEARETNWARLVNLALSNWFSEIFSNIWYPASHPILLISQILKKLIPPFKKLFMLVHKTSYRWRVYVLSFVGKLHLIVSPSLLHYSKEQLLGGPSSL